MYDLESIVMDLKKLFIDELNNEITLVSQDKAAIDLANGETITLSQVDNSSYVFQSMDTNSINKNPFIFFALDTVESKHEGATVMDIVSINFILFLADNGNDNFIIKKLLRYYRAMKEVVRKNFDNKLKFQGSNLVTEMLEPSERLKLLNSTNYHRAIGLRINITI